MSEDSLRDLSRCARNSLHLDHMDATRRAAQVMYLPLTRLGVACLLVLARRPLQTSSEVEFMCTIFVHTLHWATAFLTGYGTLISDRGKCCTANDAK